MEVGAPDRPGSGPHGVGGCRAGLAPRSRVARRRSRAQGIAVEAPRGLQDLEVPAARRLLALPQAASTTNRQLRSPRDLSPASLPCAGVPARSAPKLAKGLE